MGSCVTDWPEPIVRVQSLSDSNLPAVPDRYVKPITDRPSVNTELTTVNIPLIDFSGLLGDDDVRATTLDEISQACREWGFFQAINHGVSPELMDRARETWRCFFHQPMEVKQAYGNSPKTYEGYGSRLGIEKGAILDWSDYYFLHCLPSALKDHNKWPALPSDLREVIDEYSRQVAKFGGDLLKVFSINLGLSEDYLQNAFGGENVGACLRVNFYPKCPQPDLTLGLSSHSDPGGMTLLLPDQNVPGLQVRKNDDWITVKPAPHAFIVNIGDQIQESTFDEFNMTSLCRDLVLNINEDSLLCFGICSAIVIDKKRIFNPFSCKVLSNAIYKSIEHRVIVNSNKERISLAFFYNPKGDMLIEPAKELVTPETPALYNAMTFDEYRLFIRLRGPKGKAQVESLKSPR